LVWCFFNCGFSNRTSNRKRCVGKITNFLITDKIRPFRIILKSKKKNSELDQFKGIYLEDSFVLQIIEWLGKISFKTEFVLTKANPLSHQPKIDEIYCYQNGFIYFIFPFKVIWEYKNIHNLSIDAKGETDLGNIDAFYETGENYSLEGDWGKVLISCKELRVELA